MTSENYEGQMGSAVMILSPTRISAQIQENESILKLCMLSKDFVDISISFLRARCCLHGYPDLHTVNQEFIQTSKEIIKLFNSTVAAVTVFQRNSQAAVNNMHTAFDFLQENNPTEAMRTFKSTKRFVQNMEEKASGLSEEYLEVLQSLIKIVKQTQQEEVKQTNQSIQKQEDQCKFNGESLAEEETVTSKRAKMEIAKAADLSVEVTKLKQSKDLLQKAISALYGIQAIVIKTAILWKENGAIFDIKEDYFANRISTVDTKEECPKLLEECQKLFNSGVFKRAGQQYFIKWTAIKGALDTSNALLKEIDDSIHEVIRTVPNDEVVKFVLSTSADELPNV